MKKKWARKHFRNIFTSNPAIICKVESDAFQEGTHIYSSRESVLNDVPPSDSVPTDPDEIPGGSTRQSIKC